MKALFAQGNNKLQREAPQRGSKHFPSVAVGVTAPLIGHGWPKGNPLKALFAQGRSALCDASYLKNALGSYAFRIRALKGQKHYVRAAFALTGRGYLGVSIPRAMPWAMSSLAFQAAIYLC